MVSGRRPRGRPCGKFADARLDGLRIGIARRHTDRELEMWRKLGTWLWLVTQNLGDFPDAASWLVEVEPSTVCISLP